MVLSGQKHPVADPGEQRHGNPSHVTPCVPPKLNNTGWGSTPPYLKNYGLQLYQITPYTEPVGATSTHFCLLRPLDRCSLTQIMPSQDCSATKTGKWGLTFRILVWTDFLQHKFKNSSIAEQFLSLDATLMHALLQSCDKVTKNRRTRDYS